MQLYSIVSKTGDHGAARGRVSFASGHADIYSGSENGGKSD